VAQETHSLRIRFARAAALIVLAASGVVAAFATIAPAPDAEMLLSRTAILEPLVLQPEKGLFAYPGPYVREERFQRGDTFGSLLARLRVSESDRQRVLRARGLRLLRPGSTVTAEIDGDGALTRLAYLAGRDSVVSVTREGDIYRVGEANAALEMRTTLRSSVIRSSLFAAADTASIPDSVAIQLADVFGGDIDFHRDLRKGDRFSVVYEMYYLGGRPMRAGRVLAAEFISQRRVLRAVYFAGRNGRGGYYAPDGSNLRKTFLRSPLEFSRVTSGFGMRRHPFQHTWRAHRGIDYGAPVGTRVRAVADGVVELAGRKGGYGNVVILRHNGQYSTLYAHLSGLARGIRRGVRVEQGDSVGFVGQSGWATGPHLHYEFRIAGNPRNPLAVALPSAEPVRAEDRPAFTSRAAPFIAQLDLLSGTNLALLD
jgi:murein DD-endopeptidase MepM/ murein hydrolase activator NlpD